jgi:SAM-dependent methyltransferase
MRFLDVGCAASLANYRLDKWPSTYYGVDISSALVEAMRGFAAQHQISIGGLHIAELADLPFDNDFFNIASTIGVLEYCTVEYVEQALPELNRVLKSQARVVLDIPNLEHPHADMMFRLEEYLGRPGIPHLRSSFEKALSPLFSVERVDDSHVMRKYFCRAVK